MKFLITAIGSMSAECVLLKLKERQHFIVGCDIYPAEWHFETKLCNYFVQAPRTNNEKEYISFLLDLCNKYMLQFIVPLTDLEIDVINKYRQQFESKGIILCIQQPKVLDIVRNKYKLHTHFANDVNIASLKTQLLLEYNSAIPFPCVAKPFNGRSSEGLMIINNAQQLISLEHPEKYIIQEQKQGFVYTVDYCRSSLTNKDAAVPRRELLRTKNGAGLTIQTIKDKKLLQIVSYIGNELDINGCVNMEFIYNEGNYYLIDINPRFSAGVAFSVMSGYDMVNNHIKCFMSIDIDDQPKLKERIIIKKYKEVFV